MYRRLEVVSGVNRFGAFDDKTRRVTNAGVCLFKNTFMAVANEA